MRDRRNILLASTAVMVVVAVVIAASAITVQYRWGLQHQRDTLVQIAQVQARLMEAVGRFDAEFSEKDHPGGSRAATLSQIVDAQKELVGFGETGEFVIGERVGEDIVFLAPIREGETPASVGWSSTDAEPMRRALGGDSGIVRAMDYDGVSVLAAYEPVAGLGLGVVAKRDVAEIRGSVLQTALISGLVALFVIGLGAFIMHRAISPLFRRLEASEGRTRAIVATASEGIITICERGIIESFNPQAEMIFGYKAGEVVGRNVSMLMDSPYREEHDGHLEKYLKTGEAQILGRVREVEGMRKDGEIFAMELKTNEMELGERRLFTGFVQDISERKKTEHRQRRLMDELDHRVKNILAAIISLTQQTAEGMESAEDFQKRLTGRLMSMARTHEALAAAKWEGVYLEELVRGNVGILAEHRFEVQGDQVLLPARASGPLSMTLHELATNAVKYGSLSLPEGRVMIRWSVMASRAIEIYWEERGGPTIGQPEHAGLGISLIRGFIQHELGGEVELDFRSSGLVARLKIPLVEEAAYDSMNFSQVSSSFVAESRL